MSADRLSTAEQLERIEQLRAIQQRNSARPPMSVYELADAILTCGHVDDFRECSSLYQCDYATWQTANDVAKLSWSAAVNGMADVLAIHGAPSDEGRALQILVNAGFRAADVMPLFDAAMRTVEQRRAGQCA
jgi:hypothetical protein